MKRMKHRRPQGRALRGSKGTDDLWARAACPVAKARCASSRRRLERACAGISFRLSYRAVEACDAPWVWPGHCTVGLSSSWRLRRGAAISVNSKPCPPLAELVTASLGEARWGERPDCCHRRGRRRRCFPSLAAQSAEQGGKGLRAQGSLLAGRRPGAKTVGNGRSPVWNVAIAQWLVSEDGAAWACHATLPFVCQDDLQLRCGA